MRLTMATMIRRLAVLGLLCALGGCTPPGSVGSSSTAASTGPSAGPLAGPSARAGFGGPAPVTVTEATFQTPSTNIVCHLTTSSVRCDIARKSWQPPPKPADCKLAWGNGLFLDERAGLTCAGDTLLGAATETLAYGQGRQAGDIRCESAATGLTCRSDESGHGFTLAAARYTVF